MIIDYNKDSVEKNNEINQSKQIIQQKEQIIIDYKQKYEDCQKKCPFNQEYENQCNSEKNVTKIFDDQLDKIKIKLNITDQQQSRINRYQSQCEIKFLQLFSNSLEPITFNKSFKDYYKIGLFSGQSVGKNFIIQKLFKENCTEQYDKYQQFNMQLLLINNTELYLSSKKTHQPFQINQTLWNSFINNQSSEDYNIHMKELKKNLFEKNFYDKSFQDFIAKVSDVAIIVVNRYDAQSQLEIENYIISLYKCTKIVVLHNLLWAKNKQDIEIYERELNQSQFLKKIEIKEKLFCWQQNHNPLQKNKISIINHLIIPSVKYFVFLYILIIIITYIIQETHIEFENYFKDFKRVLLQLIYSVNQKKDLQYKYLFESLEKFSQQERNQIKYNFSIKNNIIQYQEEQ